MGENEKAIDKDEKICGLIRARIAEKNILKKDLARKLNVSTSMFSLLLHGDRKMSNAIKIKLIKELELQSYVTKLGL